MRWSWRREAPQLAVLAAIVAASAVAWPFVEEPAPVHWNARGEVDGYGTRLEALGILPAVALGVYLLLALLPRIDPARANYRSMAGAYALLRLVVLLFLAVVHAIAIAAALGWAGATGWVISAAAGVLFIVMGNVMGKLRPNYFAGIRTPWTLASVRSWDATHRLGGRAFAGIGVLLVLVAVVRQPWFLITVLGVAGVAIAWVVVYSYLVWRRDPDPVPATGTAPSED